MHHRVELLGDDLLAPVRSEARRGQFEHRRHTSLVVRCDAAVQTAKSVVPLSTNAPLWAERESHREPVQKPLDRVAHGDALELLAVGVGAEPVVHRCGAAAIT